MNFTNEKLFKIFKDSIILILACGFLFFGIAFAYSKFFVKQIYYSESKFTASSGVSKIESAGELNLARQLVNTYIEILDTNNFFTVVHDNLSQDIQNKYSIVQLKSWATFSSTNTEIIKVYFSCPDKEYTQQITSKIVEMVPNYLNASSYNVSCWTVENALEGKLSNNKTIQLSIISFILGMALVFVIAVLREMLDIRVKNVKELVERYDVPVLGAIPAFKGKVIKKEDGING